MAFNPFFCYLITIYVIATLIMTILAIFWTYGDVLEPIHVGFFFLLIIELVAATVLWYFLQKSRPTTIDAEIAMIMNIFCLFAFISIIPLAMMHHLHRSEKVICLLLTFILIIMKCGLSMLGSYYEKETFLGTCDRDDL